jgi:U32 family peptidase
MRILSPADHVEEIALLAEAGADEFYGGFLPPAWDDAYAAVGSLNKRTFMDAQFATADELAAGVEAAHALARPFYLTLNNNFYPAAQMPLVLDEVERALRLDIDALIVADLGLILEIKKRGYPIELHISILAAVMNSGAARFYAGLGAARIVLDRSLTTKEASRIISSEPELDFESFLMYGKCPNVEGLCSFFHDDNPEHVWPCGYDCHRMPALGTVASAAAAQATWSATPRGNACGLCGYYELEKAGLAAVKIAGRGRRTEDKLKAVSAISLMRDISLSGAGPEALIETARHAHRDLFDTGCDPYSCYFPAED